MSKELQTVASQQG